MEGINITGRLCISIEQGTVMCSTTKNLIKTDQHHQMSAYRITDLAQRSLIVYQSISRVRVLFGSCNKEIGSTYRIKIAINNISYQYLFYIYRKG